MDGRCILQLCDPDGLPAPDAIRLARQLSHAEPDVPLNLCAFIAHLAESSEIDPRTLRRALELLYAVSGPASFARICEHMSLSGNPMVSGLFRWLQIATPRRMRHCV